MDKIRGHVGRAKEQMRSEAKQRQEAETGRHTFLTKRDIQGEWDVSRVLTTTLGGSPRPLTTADLAAFRKNIDVAKRAFKGSGITPIEVLDLAKAKPLKYVNPVREGAVSDLDKAKKDITRAIPASISNGTMRWLTNASPESDVNGHTVIVELKAFQEAALKLSTVKTGDTAAIRKVARWLRKQKVAFDCDCGRHKYFLRYLATQGGFNAGRPEHGFPKINNPTLQGVACKHVLRVMSELDSSEMVLGQLTRFLEKIHRSDNNKARTALSQKEADELAKKRTRVIKTTDDKKNDARKAAERRAAIKAARQAERLKAKTPAATRRYKRMLENGEISVDDLVKLLVANDIDPSRSLK